MHGLAANLRGEQYILKFPSSSFTSSRTKTIQSLSFRFSTRKKKESEIEIERRIDLGPNEEERKRGRKGREGGASCRNPYEKKEKKEYQGDACVSSNSCVISENDASWRHETESLSNLPLPLSFLFLFPLLFFSFFLSCKPALIPARPENAPTCTRAIPPQINRSPNNIKQRIEEARGAGKVAYII